MTNETQKTYPKGKLENTQQSRYTIYNSNGSEIFHGNEKEFAKVEHLLEDGDKVVEHELENTQHRTVKCKKCEQDYYSLIEEDYTDCCADCEVTQ